MRQFFGHSNILDVSTYIVYVYNIYDVAGKFDSLNYAYQDMKRNSQVNF